MKPVYGTVGLALLGWLTAGADSAHAAWDNVFQVTCHCKDRTGPIRSFFRGRTAYSAPYSAPVAVADDCCPPPVRISYRQRCYYQPVTTYKMQTRYEPVTSYRMSYYYEPVRTVRYRSYIDPCTGCCKRVACESTSYRLRSRCNAVVNYVQRCEMVPVTSYKRTCCYEPVVTCPPDPCATPGVTELPGSVAPAIDEGGAYPAPGISEQPGNGDTLPPMQIPEGTGLERAKPFESSVEPPLAAPKRIDRIAADTGPRVRGRVVASDRSTPQSGARIIFVSARKTGVREKVTADRSGQFDVSLPQGEWLMYLADGSGKAVYHSRVSLKPTDHRLVTVVSR